MGSNEAALPLPPAQVTDPKLAKLKQEQDINAQKTLLNSYALHQYILDTSVYPREAPVLKELREHTQKTSWNCGLATTPEEGQFIMLLLSLINAKKTLEVGVFTGYSLLCTALALPEDGTVIALDYKKEYYDVGAPFIEKAGVAHKIDFREGPAIDSIDLLLQDETNLDSFDFIFVDADKPNYLNYHHRLMKLVRVGGLIGYDNTLWGGSVAEEPVEPPVGPIAEYIHLCRPFVLEFNKFIAQDERLQISQVPISDGITLCKRLH